jgi:hypothetical protein
MVSKIDRVEHVSASLNHIGHLFNDSFWFSNMLENGRRMYETKFFVVFHFLKGTATTRLQSRKYISILLNFHKFIYFYPKVITNS